MHPFYRPNLYLSHKPEIKLFISLVVSNFGFLLARSKFNFSQAPFQVCRPVMSSYHLAWKPTSVKVEGSLLMAVVKLLHYEDQNSVSSRGYLVEWPFCFYDPCCYRSKKKLQESNLLKSGHISCVCLCCLPRLYPVSVFATFSLKEIRNLRSHP
jgi:hypothetical protein